MSVRGAITIYGQLRPAESSNFQHQTLFMFLAELDDEAVADRLLELSQQKQARRNNFVVTAVKEGRLFCLVVARSGAAGTKSFETQKSVQRFVAGIAKVLRQF